ncbi:MAG: hypothetical protein H7A55_09780 [Verrucomicrobiaceae bacterium]|nr:hypothetical protein [Verrucomicrobiaceae bacterium]
MIWVLTAGFGDGHNTAARCVGEALRRRLPHESVVVTDLVSEAQPMVAEALKSAYQVAITHVPSAWRAVYRLLENPKLAGDNWLQAPLKQALVNGLEQHRPRLIISTYPFYSHLLKALPDKSLVPPLVTVVTDSTSVHPIWTSAPSDLYCVSDVETEQVLQQQGVAAEQIRVTGFPVDLAFAAPLPDHAKAAPGQRILYLPSTPARTVAATLEALRPLLNEGVRLTIPAGRQWKRLYHTLRRFDDTLRPGQMTIIGWTQDMPHLLRSHDVIICKAGGAILHEVLAARTPAVIDYVVPGQEEGNAAYLVSRDCGVRTQTPQETGSEVRRLLADGGAVARRMQENMIPVSVPDAALRTADAALEMVSVSKKPAP